MTASLVDTLKDPIESRRPTPRTEFLAAFFASIWGFVVLMTSLGYTFLIYPQADDLERTAAMRVFSPVVRTWSDYNAIDGRWASLMLAYLQYLGDNVIDRYPYMLSSLLLVGLAGLCCGIAVITGRKMSVPLFAGALCLYGFIWVSAPRGEIFYWYPATADCWLPVMLGLILFWVLFKLDGRLSGIVVVAMSVLVPALHEVFGSWIIAVLGITWLVQRFKGKPNSATPGIAALASVLGTLSVVLAPGVRARANGIQSRSIGDSLKHALHIERLMLAHWPAITLALLVIMFLMAQTHTVPAWYDENRRWIRAGLLFAMTVLPFVMLTVISYTLGGDPPGRVYDGVYLLFIIAAATFAACSGFDISRSRPARELLDGPEGSLFRAGLIFLAIIVLSSLPRFQSAFRDIRPAIRNRAVWDERNSEIWAKKKSGVRDIVVEPRMVPVGVLPFYFDLSEDPTWYVNQDMNSYYEIHSIRLSKQADQVK